VKYLCFFWGTIRENSKVIRHELFIFLSETKGEKFQMKCNITCTGEEINIKIKGFEVIERERGMLAR